VPPFEPAELSEDEPEELPEPPQPDKRAVKTIGIIYFLIIISYS
jgi:hypothetical protein